MSRVRIKVPRGFHFRATVMSHGWCYLAPFSWDMEAGTLERPLRVPGGKTAVVRLSQPGGRGKPLEAAFVAGAGSRGEIGPRPRAAVEAAVSRMLFLDADLTGFHDRCRSAGPPFAAAAESGYGRMLRSATLFEDLVKILATTNTTWGGTKAMVAKLVTLCGTDGSFPSPEEVAAAGAARLRDESRWGYRAEALAELAESIAGGRLDPARWESWEGSSEELEQEVRGLRGFGPYAAAEALALLGRHDFIGVDTVFRGFVRKRHFPRARKMPSDRRMLAIYDAWGEWRGLAYWYEMWASVMEDRDLLRTL